MEEDRWLSGFTDRLPFQIGEPGGEEKELEDEEVVGVKSISYFGGIALLVNNITGPAMVTIAPMFQKAGWLVPFLMMLFATIWSSFSSTLMCAVMTMIPGNNKLQSRVEMTSLVDRLFYDYGRAPFWICSFFFNASLFFLNVSTIIVSVQTMDFLLIALLDWTAALELYPNFEFISRNSHSFDKYSLGIASSDSPFDNPLDPEENTCIISMGFLLTMLIIVPLGFVNLNDNIYVQIISFYTMFAAVSLWVFVFIFEGLDFSNTPVFEPSLPTQDKVLGNILFNYAFVVTVPSWINEKNPRAPINSSIWLSTIVSTIFYLVVGFFGSWATHYTGNQNTLDVLINLQLESSFLQTILRISAYIFPIVSLSSSIPVYSIIIRYNLLENKQCNIYWANFWGVIFPWLFSIPFCTGEGLTEVIDYAGLFIQGAINFLIPLALYIRAIRMQNRGVLTKFLCEYDNRFPEMALEAAPPFDEVLMQEGVHDDDSDCAPHSEKQLELEPPPHDPFPSFFSYLGFLFEPFNFAVLLFMGFALINTTLIILSFVD